MHVGFLTDGLGHRPLSEVLEMVQEMGIAEIELATGNWSTAPHVDVPALLNSAQSRERLLEAVSAHGVRIGALNASGNVLHPLNGREQDRVVRDTMRLAQELGVDTIVMMSGLPPVYDGDKIAPWIVTCWPPENVSHLERQWTCALRYWEQLVTFAAACGIRRIAIEMHADQLVYNPQSVLRLRSELGEIVGANFDPSHLQWMGADPRAAAAQLTGAIHHVHAKEARIEALAATRTVLEVLPFGEPNRRAWNYVGLGEGHPEGAAYWRGLCDTLRRSGYDGVLSIEHEDPGKTPEEGLACSVQFLRERVLN